MSLKIIPLGAGQEVGRSCIILCIDDKNIMLDCGIHMQSDQKFPNFNFLKDKNEGLDIDIDLVLITHFHNDHCGALPYFTEQFGYDGPVIMTHPTKAIIPLMLEDARKIEEREAKKNTNTSKQNYGGMNNQQMTGMEEEGRNPYFNKFGDQNFQQPPEKDSNMFEAGRVTKDMINKCIRRCKTIQLHETMEVNGIKLKAYYAGHVLGAVMFYIEYNGIS